MYVQDIARAFVLPSKAHSKRMILWIVILIFRNEASVHWVLHRDQPKGEILSPKETILELKAPERDLGGKGTLKLPWCRGEFQPGGGWHSLRGSVHIAPLAPFISFTLGLKRCLQEDEGEGPQLQRAPVVISHLVQREPGDCSKNLSCGSKYSS